MSNHMNIEICDKTIIYAQQSYPKGYALIDN